MYINRYTVDWEMFHSLPYSPLPCSAAFSFLPKRLKNYKGTEFLSMSRDVDKFYRCLWMSRDVDKFYRCLATSIDFIDVSPCLATSIDIDTCSRRGWAQTRATTTTMTSIDFIDVSRCLATSIDVDTCIV